MRYILILFFIWSAAMAQPVSQRTNGQNTMLDPNLMASKSLIIPRYEDTTAANASGTGLDSAGKIIYTRSDQKFWVRSHLHQWITAGGGGGSGLTLQQVLDNGNSALDDILLTNGAQYRTSDANHSIYIKPYRIEFNDDITSNRVLLQITPSANGSYDVYFPDRTSADTIVLQSDLIPYLKTIAHDVTLTGDGTSISPLKVDTTKISSKYSFDTLSSIVSNKWKQGGNSFGANGITGTNDNYPFIFNQNGVERFRFAATTGNALFYTTSDNGTDKLQVNGSLISTYLKQSISGLGNVSQNGLLLLRTEGVQSWGFGVATAGDGTSSRGLTLFSSNTTGAINFNMPAGAFFFGDVIGNANFTFNASSELRKTGGPAMAFRNAGNGIAPVGYDFYSATSATGRPNPTTVPMMSIDGDARVKIGGNTAGITNYAAALDVKSTYGAFIPPRLTTAQRDSITGVHDIIITATGTGYSSAPTVVFTGGGGSGAAATATLVSTSVLAITVTATGFGYTSAPTISFTGGGGSGAAATAHIGTLEEGMEIYNITTHKHQGWNGTSWNDFY
jgi:hypothetical protein